MDESGDRLKQRIASKLKRVRIVIADGRACYCVGAWPGWKNLRLMFLIIGVLVFVEAVMVLMQYQFTKSFAGDGWFNLIARFAVPWPLAFQLTVALLLLFSPLMVMSLLSSKRVWVSGSFLHAEKTFLGWTRHKRIPVEDIMDIKLGKDGSRGAYFYKIFASYRPRLPVWLRDALPRRMDRWAVLLLDAIPSKEEAEFICDKLLDEVIIEE